MPKKNPKYQDKIKQDWKNVTKDDVARKEPNVRLSFEHVTPGEVFCLSHCSSDDVRQAIDCFRKICSMTWSQVHSTATKERGQKTGLHWTQYSDDALNVARPSSVGSDQNIAGIRASDKFRIFGFRFGDYFHVIWFDPGHDICDG